MRCHAELQVCVCVCQGVIGEKIEGEKDDCGIIRPTPPPGRGVRQVKGRTEGKRKGER